jgi:ketosteroid isomerase-like protein
VRRAFEALNAGDPYVFLEAYDADIELWVPAFSGLDSGVMRGAKEVELWYAHTFAQWGNPHYEVEQLIEWGPHVAALGRWVGRGRRSGIELESEWVTIFSFSEGKIVSIAQLGGAVGLGRIGETP